MHALVSFFSMRTFFMCLFDVLLPCSCLLRKPLQIKSLWLGTRTCSLIDIRTCNCAIHCRVEIPSSSSQKWEELQRFVGQCKLCPETPRTSSRKQGFAYSGTCAPGRMSNREWPVMAASLLGRLDGACKGCSTLQCPVLSNPLKLAVAQRNLDVQPPEGASSRATSP